MTVSRRQLLRGDFGERLRTLRPPGALSEAAFIEVCTSCRECIAACPEAIIISGAGRYPELDFSRGECSLCGACVEHCPTGALQAAAAGWRQWAGIDEACLERQGVTCGSCVDPCPALAIAWRRHGRIAIDADLCTGCGACYRVCPARAIAIHQERQDGVPNGISAGAEKPGDDSAAR